MNQEWKNHPALKNIDPIKLRILMELFEKGQGKKPEELLPQLMRANAELNKRGMNFTSSETKLILDILKKNMSPAEQKKVELLQNMFS